MNPQIHLIRQHIEQEVLCYRQLLEVVEQERQILLNGQHERLLGTNEQKLELAHRLGVVQDERRQALASLSPDPGRPLRLRDLGDMLSGQERGPFRAMLAKAQQMAERLAQASQTNRSFVEEALDTVEHLLGILCGQSRDHGYTASGARAAQGGPTRPRLLAREV